MTWLFTLLVTAALAVQLVNQVLVAVGVFTFAKVAVVQTAAFAGVLVWMAAVSFMTIGDDALPVGTGWLGVITVLALVILLGLMSRDQALVKGQRNPTRNELAVAVLPLLALLVWFYWVGASVWAPIRAPSRYQVSITPFPLTSTLPRGSQAKSRRINS